jgi:hypothetical protein
MDWLLIFLGQYLQLRLHILGWVAMPDICSSTFGWVFESTFPSRKSVGAFRRKGSTSGLRPCCSIQSIPIFTFSIVLMKDVIQNGTKPIVVELGPYSYRYWRFCLSVLYSLCSWNDFSLKKNIEKRTQVFSRIVMKASTIEKNAYTILVKVKYSNYQKVHK